MVALTKYHRLGDFKDLGDFPVGLVVKNLPANAGNTGSIPGQGTKIPHAVKELSLLAAVTAA